MFNVGDKIKCIDEGPGTHIHLGHIYTVHEANDRRVTIVEGMRWGSFSANRFELVVEDNRESVVLWTVVYKYMDGVSSKGYETKGMAEGFVQTLNEVPAYTVLALKKITVRI